MRKTIIFFALILVVAFTLTACGQKNIEQKQNQAENSKNQNTVGNDQDEHGCRGSAGYSWCALKNKCLRVWEEACDEKLNSDLRQLFMDKYQKPADEVRVTINQNTENHVRGGVKFGANGIGEGGIFFAAKVDGVWKLVFDGNGGIFCPLLRQYNFPSDMMSDCAE